MSPITIVLLILLILLSATALFLYFYGKRMKKQNDRVQEQIEATKQTVSLLIIDKKKMRMRDADGLPEIVVKSTPLLFRNSKVPIVKAKNGSQIITMIADNKIFDQIPVKKNVKAVVSGIYIVGLKGSYSNPDAVQKKQGKFASFMDKLQEKAGAKPIK